MTKPRSVAATANDNSIPGSRLENLSITESKLQAGSVTGDKIQDSSITSEKIISISADKLDDESITNDKISPDAGISSQKLSYDPGIDGGIARTVEGKLLDFVDIADFVSPGLSDTTAAIQEFFDYISTNNVGTAYCSGDYTVTSALNLGDGSVATKHIVGNLSLTAVAPIDTVLTINGFFRGTWNGSLNVTGTGSVSYAGRTCRVGILISNCGRAKFDFLRVLRFFQYGVEVTSAIVNTNMVDIGNITAIDCGSGYPGGSNLVSNWSSPVNTGNSGSPGQRTTINVSTLPPEPLGSDDSNPVVLLIEGETYLVTNIDRTNSTLTVYPWIDLTLTSGSLQYIFGAGVFLFGGDAGIVNINMVDATRCGVGLWMCSLYGPIAKRVVTQFCLCAVAIASRAEAASVTFQISGLYCEGNPINLLRVTRAPIGGFIASEYAFDFDKIRYTGDPRLSSNSYSDTWNNLSSIIFNSLGVSHEYSRRRDGRSESSNEIGVGVDDSVKVYKRDSWTIGLFADAALNDAFGYQSTSVVFIGTGANNAPTGSFTFNPPSGATVNGGPSATFSGFTKPATFYVYWEVESNNFIVALA
jgi:hypothetical protein